MSHHVWSDRTAFIREPQAAAEVLRVLDIPRLDTYHNAVAQATGVDLSALQRLTRNTLMEMPPEDHLKVRRVIAPFFSRAGMAGWRDLVRHASEEVAESLEAIDEPDLVRDYCVPLFLRTIPEIIGLDLPQETAYFDAVVTAQRLTEPYLSVSALKSLNAAVALLADCFTQPRDDDPEGRPKTLRAYLHERQADLPDRLDPDFFVLGMLVGSNTITQSLAFACHGLLSGPPEDWAAAAIPGSAQIAPQRLLGLYQSTRTLVRVAPSPVEAGGCPYSAGETAVVDIVDANTCLRAQTGNPTAHMSFGSGAHKCPGAFLSETILDIAIPVLARRYPDMILEPERCRFVQTPMMQAPIAMPCTLRQDSRRKSARLCDIRDLPSAGQVLRDDATFAPPPMESHLRVLAQESGQDFDTAVLVARNAMFFMEGPRHTALRAALARDFDAAMLAEWAPRIDTAIDQALDGLVQAKKPDLVAGFSEPLRLNGVAPVLGVHSPDRARFDAVAPGLQEVLEPWLSMRHLTRVQACFAEALSLMQDPAPNETPRSLLAALLANPPEDFSPDDLRAVVLVLYGASFNLSHTLANIVLWILSRPAEERQNARDPAWIDDNLEALIARYSGPKYIYRQARADRRVGDLHLRMGDTARLAVHALNRGCPAGAGHLSFGKGLHRCVGARLSREIIRKAIPALFTRFPGLAPLAQAHRYHAMSQTVALSTLPCALTS
ncbi:cytochrome P450 [Rhodobacter sp. NTK016B]|uniref:cytochrome P450 n=1 Tax=Rhodobacter sp. NTK016B TaxID=2759676 RepID=UPI001A90700C|nr:cytochrome P450 [Rhodobacter sp. NTK016B]MBN8293700.1 cytochrome P450 [Rhodobacter sp. NTK016B]